MNLLHDHARGFRQYHYCLIALYASMGLGSVGWGLHESAALTHTLTRLEQSTIEHAFITIKKEETLTMQEVKNQLTHLFAIPLAGISFTTLSLDEEGMRVRGNARTASSFEMWLGQVSEAFSVDEKSIQPASIKGMLFEVLLHEKS